MKLDGYPRCATCRWFENTGHNWGECHLHSEANSGRMAMPIGVYGDENMQVDADFGCVQHSELTGIYTLKFQ